MEIELVDAVDNHVKYGIIYTREDVKDCLDQEIEAVKPEMKLKGFRPGKVPSDYIFRMYGEKLRIQAMNKRVTSDISKIITDNKYELASQPIYNFRPRQDIDDNNFYVELDLFLMPALPVLDYEKIELNTYQPNEEAFQEILDKNLLMFQIMTADFENIINKPSEENDKITFTIEVTVDDTVNTALSGTMQAILGQEQAPPEIEAQLRDVKLGQEIVYTHEYAADATDLFAPNLAGTKTTYKIKIEKIERPIIHELDEARIQKIGFSDAEHLFQVLETNTRSTLGSVSFGKMKHDFLVYLKDAYKDVQIPEFILKQEAYRVAMAEASANTDADIMEQITTGTIKIDITDKHTQDAQEYMRVGLFLRQYAKDNNIIVTDTELKRELERHLPELTRLNTLKPEQKEQNYRQVTNQAQAIVLEIKVLQSIFDRVSLKEVLLSKDGYFNVVKPVVG